MKRPVRYSLLLMACIVIIFGVVACGGSDSDNVTNAAPVANAGPDRTVTAGAEVTLDGSASSDVDATDTLTYSWSFTSVPNGSNAALSDATLVNPTFTVDLTGAYTIQLVVSDGMIDSAPDSVVITASGSLPAIAAGDYHSLALVSGSLWGWGSNGSGQLGTGDTDPRYLPVKMVSDSNWSRVAAGYRHTMALKSDGTLWVWGDNADGQLGLGYVDSTHYSSPIQVGSGTDWLAITAGDYHSFAVKTDGSLWAWGFNSTAGQLGVGDTTPRYSPVQVGSGTNWSSVTAGRDSFATLALQHDGSLWAWGYNGNGQLGLGDTNSRLSPVQVGSDTDWSAVMSGGQHTLALKTDGSLWSWGGNGDGQLGLGDNLDRLSPVQVGSDTDWSAVDAGYGHSLALKADGSLWAWGFNFAGELGVGDTILSSNIPIRVGSGNTWTTVKAGGLHSLAVQADGTLWAWGDNLGGQLGQNDTIQRHEPVQVVGVGE